MIRFSGRAPSQSPCAVHCGVRETIVTSGRAAPPETRRPQEPEGRLCAGDDGPLSVTHRASSPNAIPVTPSTSLAVIEIALALDEGQAPAGARWEAMPLLHPRKDGMNSGPFGSARDGSRDRQLPELEGRPDGDRSRV